MNLQSEHTRLKRKPKTVEYITNLMEKKIDAYILQETHLEGDYTKTMNNCFLIIHHSPPRQPKNGAKGGVVIIMSKKFDKEWRKAGNKTRLGGVAAGNTTRVLAIDVHLKLESNSKRRNAKTKGMSFISCYHPTSVHKDEQAPQFNEKGTQMLNTAWISMPQPATQQLMMTLMPTSH